LAVSVQDLMAADTGLPGRLALLLFTIPVVYACLLGIAGNWPVDCGPGRCADSDLAGSAVASGLFGVALLIYVTGAVLFAFKRIGPGLALLAIAAALAAFGLA
jgi:hypothetical protein